MQTSRCLNSQEAWRLLLALDRFGLFPPKSVLCDFEFAIHNAMEQVWPSTALCGCFFCHKQAMFQNIACLCRSFQNVPETLAAQPNGRVHSSRFCHQTPLPDDGYHRFYSRRLHGLAVPEAPSNVIFSLWEWQSSAVTSTKSRHGLEHHPPIQPFLTTNGTSTFDQDAASMDFQHH